MKNKKESVKASTRSIGTSDRLLPVRLTESELLKYGDDLAQVVQNIGAEEDRQASLKQELKARLAQLEARRTELASLIARKEEHRLVKVEATLDFIAQVYVEIRQDTGEEIKRRALTEEERQESLELETASR